jgi:hypothetical protein
MVTKPHINNSVIHNIIKKPQIKDTVHFSLHDLLVTIALARGHHLSSAVGFFLLKLCQIFTIFSHQHAFLHIGSWKAAPSSSPSAIVPDRLPPSCLTNRSSSSRAASRRRDLPCAAAICREASPCRWISSSGSSV